MRLKYDIFGPKVRSTLLCAEELIELQKGFDQYPSRLGKRPTELKAQFKDGKIILRYDFHIDYNNRMNGPFGVHTIVTKLEKEAICELTTSYESITTLSVIVLSLLYFGIVPILVLKTQQWDIITIYLVALMIYLLSYFRLMINLKGVHKTSVRLLQRSKVVSNKNYT